jgi:chemotaxis protein histidine kinase CheA
MKGLVVEACGQRFWLPLEAVLFVARAGGEHGALRLPRASAPIVSLAERLNLSAKQDVRYAVVLRGARIAYAVAVEEVVGLEAREASGARPLVPADLLSAEEEERLAAASPR